MAHAQTTAQGTLPWAALPRTIAEGHSLCFIPQAALGQREATWKAIMGKEATVEAQDPRASGAPPGGEGNCGTLALPGLQELLSGAGLPGGPRPKTPRVLLVQVEDAMLDTYDLVYDQAVRSPSSIQWQELTAIQDTVSGGGAFPSPAMPQAVNPTVLQSGHWTPPSFSLPGPGPEGLPGHRARLPTCG